MSFEPNDRVAWHHEYATQHAPGSTVYEDAVRANAPGAQFGAVTGSDDTGTLWTVTLDDGSERVLTGDELVKVA